MKQLQSVQSAILSAFITTVGMMAMNDIAQEKSSTMETVVEEALHPSQGAAVAKKPLLEEQTDTMSILCIKDPYNPFLCASDNATMSS